MSYILDALKKSEKKRQNGTVPDLMTVQDIMAQKPRKRLLWPYLLLIALLLNAGILAWWLSPWQSKKPKVVVQSSAGQQHGLKTLESAHEVSGVQLPAVAAPSSIPGNTISQKVRTGGKDSVDAIGSHEISTSVPQQTPTPKHLSNESQSHTNTRITSEQEVVTLKDLPSSIQESLPAFNITVSVYSDDPASRIVKINGQKLQEGQYLTDGLKLEEITRNGVIFSYQNYRFHVGLNGT
jgi:general secretion pathway protein B